MKNILVTGISCSGKSTVCEALSEEGYSAYNIEEIEGLYQDIDRTTGKSPIDHHNDDLEKVKKVDWVCDLEKLKTLIKSDASDIAFCCGTATNVTDMVPLFDKVVLLKTTPQETKRRLASREAKGHGEPKGFGHTEEVQDWVLSYKSEWEDKVEIMGAVVVDAERPREEVVASIKKELGLI